MGYDVIGDIHGQADKLEALLTTLGYRDTTDGWLHPQRTAVFVGDFIDRGPQQVRTVNLVSRMVSAGLARAVMGNHEFNAIAWHTPDPEQPGEYLRSHFSEKYGAKNRQQHERFLAEVEHLPAEHARLIAWFRTLPLWLDLDGIRVVHACWHGSFMNWLQQSNLGDDQTLSKDLLAPATREPDDESEKDIDVPSVFKAVEALTKGIEIPAPEGHSFRDKDGHERNRVRVRWWDPDASTYRTAAMMSEADRERLPDTDIPAHARIGLDDRKPVFFGHYWLTGRPAVVSPHAACVDYSAGKGGPLVAYRWDGESVLTDKNFVSVA
ncbi:metallophosphoesterase [Azoarcus sp. KH32C]|uniref:metallophosphoesterase n=1 Tax=Azoarcus sp. KH32C TaxID=748247 RepID=UPI0002385FB6|nr:metallophosphoesterase [Azoarcus sp. KH32C]BAL23473.1 metallophosphoesterase [Azoarcus sp. KH32C]